MSDFRDPVWTAKRMVGGVSDGVTIEVSNEFSAIIRSPISDPVFTQRSAPPGMHFGPSWVIGPLSLFFFGSLYVASLFLRFLLRVLPSRLCVLPSLSSLLSSLSLLRSVSHSFLSASVEVAA